MRQVHVALKPKPTRLETDDSENQAPLRKEITLQEPIKATFFDKHYRKNSSAASSNDASETKSLSYEDITCGYDLQGDNRVSELIAFSEDVSQKIG